MLLAKAWRTSALLLGLWSMPPGAGAQAPPGQRLSVLGHQVCRAYGSSASDGCAGTALWYAALGGMLGGLIGAAGGGDRDP